MLHWCKNGGEAAALVRNIVARLDATWPGLKADVLKDEPGEGLLVRCLGQVREQACQEGKQSVSLRDLDRAVSIEGTRARQYLAKNGYSVGKLAWRTLRGKRRREEDEAAQARQSGGC